MTFDQKTIARSMCALLLSLGVPAIASAQGKSSQEEIEGGATRPSSVEIHAGHRGGRGAARQSSLRIGLQARLDAFNSLATSVPDADTTAVGRHLLVPMVAPGVRLLDERLYLGLGLGLAGGSEDNGNTTTSRSGFSLTPMAHYDVLEEGPVALSLGGWFNFAHLGETEVCGTNCVTMNNDSGAWGLTLVGGLHATIVEGLSLGGEFGWGFLSISTDPGTDTFVHSLFGAIVLEASLGL